MRLSSLLLEPLGIMPLPDPLLYLALLGFANALVWPAVWPLALEGLGHLTAVASALLIMGIAGGALLPLLYGALVHQGVPHQSAYGILLPCYDDPLLRRCRPQAAGLVGSGRHQSLD